MKQSILYIEPNRGIFYNADNPDMLQLNFPPDVVKDLDLLNKEKLYALIQAFAEAYQILPSPIVLLLSSSITFDKDITSDMPETETQTFIDLVPFQSVLTHTFSFGNKTKIISANKEFIDSILTGFQKVHCDINLVLPFSVVQEIMPELENNFDLSLILNKVDSLKQYNMLDEKEVKQNQTNDNIKQKTKEETKQAADKKRLSLLLVVFGFLFIIMILMAFVNLSPPPRKRVKGISTFKTNIPFYIINIGK